MSYQQELKQSHEDWSNYLTVAETVIYGAITWSLGWAIFIFASVTAFMLSKKTNILFKIAQDLKHRPECVNEYRKANFAINLRLIIAGFSLAIAFASIYVHYKSHQLTTNPAVLAASQQIEISQNNLQIAQASLQYTEGQYLIARGEAARLNTEIKVEGQKLKDALSKKLNDWKQKKENFWSAKNSHATSLMNNQVMTENCEPKRSPYGGGFLRTAANKLCGQWQLLKTAMPNIVDSNEIELLKKQLQKQQTIIGESEKIKRLKNSIVIALQNKADLINQIGGGKSYDSGFALIVGFIGSLVTGVTGDIIIALMTIDLVIVILLTISLTAVAQKINEDYGPAVIEGQRFVYDEPEIKTSWYKKAWTWFTTRRKRLLQDEKKPVTSSGVTTSTQETEWTITPKISLTFSDSYNLKNGNETIKEGTAGLTPVTKQELTPSNDPTFEKATELLKTGQLKPTQYALKEWSKNNGVKITILKLKEWLMKWVKMGLIEPALAHNGRQTYRLKA